MNPEASKEEIAAKVRLEELYAQYLNDKTTASQEELLAFVDGGKDEAWRALMKPGVESGDAMTVRSMNEMRNFSKIAEAHGDEIVGLLDQFPHLIHEVSTEGGSRGAHELFGLLKLYYQFYKGLSV